MQIRVRSALPSSLIAAPDGIDRQLSSFKALEAYQLLSARHSWGGEHGKRIPTPGLCWKYEDLVRQLFALSFPERAGQELSIPDVYELLGAIEPAILLYYDIDEIREGVLPEEVREGLYKYMRYKGITLADFALEPMKIARAFRGYHYGVPNFDSFRAKFKVMRRMHKEFKGSLDKLQDAWNVCMQDLALFASCNQSADPMEKLRSDWGPENTELLDSLIQTYGLPEIPAPYLQFAAAPQNTATDANGKLNGHYDINVGESYSWDQEERHKPQCAGWKDSFGSRDNVIATIKNDLEKKIYDKKIAERLAVAFANWLGLVQDQNVAYGFDLHSLLKIKNLGNGNYHWEYSIDNIENFERVEFINGKGQEPVKMTSNGGKADAYEELTWEMQKKHYKAKEKFKNEK